MGFNWERGALGFAGGALSGYDYMLKSKMKEEYETKMEEARAQRAENMQIQAEKRQQAWAVHPDNPNRKDRAEDVKYREDKFAYDKLHDERMLSIQEQEMKARAADRAAAAAERAEARSMRQQELAENRAWREGEPARALKQAEDLARLNMKLQDENVKKEADKIYDVTLKMAAGTEEEKKQQAELTRTAFVYSGEKNIEGFRQATAAQQKEYNNNLISVSKENYNKSVAAINELPKEEAISSANKILEAAGNKSQVSNEAQARALLKESAALESIQTGAKMLNTVSGGGPSGALKGPGASTTPPPKEDSTKTSVLKPDVKDELIYRFAITEPSDKDKQYLGELQKTNPAAYNSFIKEAADVKKSNLSRQRFLSRYNDRQRMGQTSARDAELLNMDEKYLLNR